MPFLKLTPLKGMLLCLTALLLVIGTITFTGVWQPDAQRIIKAFDESLLANEPLQLGDIRVSLAQAKVWAERGNWSIALRLLRDARNQWEAFIPLMQSSYPAYSWSKNDINRAAAIWVELIQHAEYPNMVNLRQSMLQLESIMDKYRLQKAS